MKNRPSGMMLCFSLFLAASICHGADMPIMSVAVADNSGKTVFAGKTGADGSFSTGTLAPGNYVVKFNSSSSEVKTGRFALAVSAGKKNVTANDIPGKQFVSGGVAMKVDVGNGLNIRGSVANADFAGGMGDARIKIIDGKKFVWVKQSEIGSNIGGHWEEVGAQANLRNSNKISKDDVRRMQDHGDTHQEGFPGQTLGR